MRWPREITLISFGLIGAQQVPVIMATMRPWTAATAIFLILGAANLATAQFTFLTPGDPRLITAVVNFELQSTANGQDNYVVTVDTTQNDEILGKARISDMAPALTRPPACLRTRLWPQTRSNMRTRFPLPTGLAFLQVSALLSTSATPMATLTLKTLPQK